MGCSESALDFGSAGPHSLGERAFTLVLFYLKRQKCAKRQRNFNKTDMKSNKNICMKKTGREQ